MAVAERKELLTRVDEPAMSTAVVPHQASETMPATVSPADQTALMFERLAKDPTVDVDKLERLIAMQERIIDRNAKAEFYADFARMQGELPTVLERGTTNNGKYARHEDIIQAVRGVLKQYGFIVTFRTTFPDGGVKVIGVLAHRSGHTEDTEFVAKPDTSGNKNAIQAVGSAISYGQRYTMRSLLNIASSDDDDDGTKAGEKPKQEAAAPAGYDVWLGDLETVAREGGMPAFSKTWNESKAEFRNYLAATAPKLLASIKTKAAQVKAAR